jgi:hypothetical protein
MRQARGVLSARRSKARRAASWAAHPAFVRIRRYAEHMFQINPLKSLKGIVLAVVLATSTALVIPALPAQGASVDISALRSPVKTPKPRAGRSCVATATLEIKRRPNDGSRTVGTLQAGSAFRRISRSRSWVYGSSAAGRGWVRSSGLQCS